MHGFECLAGTRTSAVICTDSPAADWHHQAVVLVHPSRMAAEPGMTSALLGTASDQTCENLAGMGRSHKGLRCLLWELKMAVTEVQMQSVG